MPNDPLAGVSGGAFGTITALPLVRYYYPETEILVFNDSGVGVADEADPDLLDETLLAGWNASSPRKLAAIRGSRSGASKPRSTA